MTENQVENLEFGETGEMCEGLASPASDSPDPPSSNLTSPIWAISRLQLWLLRLWPLPS